MKTTSTILLLCLLCAIGYAQPTFTKVTSGAIVNDGSNTRSCAWGDYDGDGDGDLDVYVTVGPASIANLAGNNLFYQNNCDGSFTRITGINPLKMVQDGTVGVSTNWIDVDNDGDMDLFVANPGANADFLFLNNGDRTFEDAVTNIVAGTGTYSRDNFWADYDNDGAVDLFLVQDDGSGPIREDILYFNDGSGNFTKIDNGAPIVDDQGRFKKGAVGDFDNDGGY